MSYVDYLLTHTYEELPVEIKAEISATDYSQRRQLARAIAATEDLAPATPPALLAAYHNRQPPRHNRRVVPWLLAAGWLLTLLAFALYPRPEPLVHIVEIKPDQLPPDSIYVSVTDTVYQTNWRTNTITRHDTVFISQPAPPPRLVMVHDTIYRTEERPVTGSRSLRRQEEVLSLLAGLGSD